MRDGCVRECPGCAHRDWTAEQSTAQKLDWLLERLNPWKTQLESIRSLTTSRWGYRGKTCLRAEWDSKKKHWKLGLRIRSGISESGKRLYEVIPIPDCPIHSEEVRRVVRRLSETLPGDLPLFFVVISGQMVTLVLKSASFPDLSGFDPSSLGVEGVWINLNPSAGDRVFSSRGWHLLWGKRRAQFCLEIQPGEFLSFYYGVESFQQLIPSLYLDALSQVGQFFEIRSGDLVIDLCSGIGISLKKWQLAGAETLGIELNRDAVQSACLNAGVGSCLQGRVSERIPQIEEWHEEQSRQGGKPARTLVFANPPRLGLESTVTDWLAQRFRPNLIAYLSCSAGTLARDLSTLERSGYVVKRIIPYDFFPQTPHVETLTLLERTS